MRAIVLEEVNKSFGDVRACSDINLSINKGEFFTFLGPSGCGKTTLLRLIAGFITPQSGIVYLDGRDITHLPPEKRKVGMVFQNYSLFPYMSVYQNIEYGLTIQKKKAAERQKIVALYMDMVGLTGMGERRISDLSGGEQQRVALARSLAVEPSVLLLDEPLSNLDARLRDKMRVELKSLQKRLGITTIFVTHDQTEALTLSDRIAVFNAGQIVQIGSPQEIYDSPRNIFVAKFIGNTNLLKASISGDIARIEEGIELRLTNRGDGEKYLSIRPQNIQLSTRPVEDCNSFQGQIVEQQLNGVWIDFIVHVQSMVLRVAKLNTVTEKTPPVLGDKIWINLPKMALRVLEP